MKNILFIVFVSFGPNLPAADRVSVWSIDKGTEAACLEEVARYERNGMSRGRIGNLPGHRYVHAAWCEDRNEPWEGSPHDQNPGPWHPKNEAERNRWTPLWTPWGGWK